jgi:hypothetical protein
VASYVLTNSKAGLNILLVSLVKKRSLGRGMWLKWWSLNTGLVFKSQYYHKRKSYLMPKF